jgi:hypothetical protein
MMVFYDDDDDDADDEDNYYYYYYYYTALFETVIVLRCHIVALSLCVCFCIFYAHFVINIDYHILCFVL